MAIISQETANELLSMLSWIEKYSSQFHDFNYDVQQEIKELNEKATNEKYYSPMKEFAKKIASKLTSSDYKSLYSKEGVIALLKGYGYPLKENEITDSNWEEIYDILTEA